MIPTQKQCTLCKKPKPIDQFVSEFVEGYTNRCAECRALGQRAHRKYVRKNASAINAYQREYTKKRASEEPSEGNQICVRCLHQYPIEEFAIGRHGRRLQICPKCREYLSVNRKEWRKANPEKAKAQVQRALERYRRLREKCLDHYGRKCACCGDEHAEFLTLDHADGNGGKHRAEVHPASIYGWLIRNNFPPNFRTLCFNCNWSFGAYGYCPHQKE